MYIHTHPHPPPIPSQKYCPQCARPTPPQKQICSLKCKKLRKSAFQTSARITEMFVMLLQLPWSKTERRPKGGKRNVLCRDVEERIFIESSEMTGTDGVDDTEETSKVIEHTEVTSPGKHAGKENQSTSETIPYVSEDDLKRKEGQRKAEQRELVKCAARRLVYFGYMVTGEDGKETKKYCEAIFKGDIVEAATAKSDWGVRWSDR